VQYAGEVGDGLLGFCAGGQGDAQVAREQNLADRVVEVEVALGMQEMRGQQHQLAMAQGRRPPESGTPMTRFSVLPTLVKCGAKRSQMREMTSCARVLLIQRSSEAMMSGSACEAIR
jgi:hypothetical protein